jgi:class 3 adenylate cyclase
MLVEQSKGLAAYDKENTRLLKSMLPAPIVEKLKQKIPVPAEYFAQVTVIFVQICQFSHLAEILTSHKLVKLLNTIYSKFDDVTDEHEVYKIETVGEVYVAVAGCPKRVRNHGILAANFALAVQKAMTDLHQELSRILPLGESVKIHVGLNTGQINAGIVGRDINPRFKLFGDTVNTASRMETTCPMGQVQCSAATAAHLTSGYVLEPRTVEVKGKGQMKTFIIKGHKSGTDKWARGRPIKNLDALIVRKMSGRGVISPRCRAILVHLAVLAKQRVAKWHKEREQLSEMTQDDDKQDCEMFNRVAETICCLEHSLAHSCTGRKPVHDGDMMFDGEIKEPSPPTTLLGKAIHRLNALVAWMIGIDPKIVQQIQRNEKLYQDRHREDILTKLRFCVLAGMGLLLLLEFPAFVGPYISATEEENASNGDRQIVSMAVGSSGLWGIPPMLVIHGIYAPACGILLLLAYTKLFEDPQYRYLMRFIVGIFLFFCGLGSIYIATIILLTGANYAEVAVLSYLVILFNVTALSVNWRVSIGLLVVCLYFTTCLVVDTQVDESSASTNALFIALYFILQTLPVLANEQYQRENFVKRESLRKQQLMLETEQGKADKLLGQLLPPKIVAQLKAGWTDVADDFQSVSVLFTDMKGFTAYSAQMTPDELVEFLNNMYSAFDEVLEEHGLTKVEVIGDAYYVVGGCPDVLPAQEHAVNTVDAALAMLRMLPRVIVDPTVQMRVGVHSGPVVAAIVGKRDPRYHLFGATVSYAEKMESHGIPGRVHVSETTYALLKDIPRFHTECRGGIEIEGEEGKKMTYLVSAPPKRLASSRAQKLGNILLG